MCFVLLSFAFCFCIIYLYKKINKKHSYFIVVFLRWDIVIALCPSSVLHPQFHINIFWNCLPVLLKLNRKHPLNTFKTFGSMQNSDCHGNRKEKNLKNLALRMLKQLFSTILQGYSLCNFLSDSFKSCWSVEKEQCIFVFHGYKCKLQKSSLQNLRDFNESLQGCSFGSSIRFLQLSLIHWKTWLPVGRAFLPHTCMVIVQT